MTFLWWGYNGPFPLWSVAGFWRVWIVRCLVCVGSWRRDSQMDTRTTLSTGQHGVWLCWQASRRGWLSTLTPPCLSSPQAVADWTDLPVTDRLLPQPDLSLRRMQASGVQVRLTDLGGTLDGFLFPVYAKTMMDFALWVGPSYSFSCLLLLWISTTSSVQPAAPWICSLSCCWAQLEFTALILLYWAGLPLVVNIAIGCDYHSSVCVCVCVCVCCSRAHLGCSFRLCRISRSSRLPSRRKEVRLGTLQYAGTLTDISP